MGFGELDGHSRGQRAPRLHPFRRLRTGPHRGIPHLQLNHRVAQIPAAQLQQKAAAIAGFEGQLDALHLPAGAQMRENLRARIGVVHQRRRPEILAHDFAAAAPAQPQESRIGFHHLAGEPVQQQHSGPQILKCLGEKIAGFHRVPF